MITHSIERYPTMPVYRSKLAHSRSWPAAHSALALLVFVAGASAQPIADPALPLNPAASAAEPDPAATPAEAPTLEPDRDSLFRISISPYAWLTSFSGDVTIRGIEVDATTSFVDILDKSDRVFGLMGAVDVEHERLVFQFNGAFSTAEISGSRGVVRDGTVDADLDMDMAWIELYGGYRFLDVSMVQDPQSSRRLTLDGFVGGRVTIVDINTTLSTSTTVTLPDGEVLNPGNTRERSVSEEWFEPFVGARLGLALSDGWALNFRADVGGFGLSGADFAWQTTALLGYHWQLDGWTLSLFGGYRALGQDYSDGDFGWDLITHGPLIGAQFMWAF